MALLSRQSGPVYTADSITGELEACITYLISHFRGYKLSHVYRLIPLSYYLLLLLTSRHFIVMTHILETAFSFAWISLKCYSLNAFVMLSHTLLPSEEYNLNDSRLSPGTHTQVSSDVYPKLPPKQYDKNLFPCSAILW